MVKSLFLVWHKAKKIKELEIEVERLNKEVDFANELIDYEERRRSFAELNLELAIEKLERNNTNDHI